MNRARAGAVAATALALAFGAGITLGHSSAETPSPKVITKTRTVTKTVHDTRTVTVKVKPEVCLQLQAELATYLAAVNAYEDASQPTLDVESDAGIAIVEKDISGLNKATGALRKIKANQSTPLRQLEERKAILDAEFAGCKSA